jgi:hypothetical protein
MSSTVKREYYSRLQEGFYFQGSGKMTQTKLRMTIFEVQKLRNIVGQGSASPYQISTYYSESLGMIGKVIDPLKHPAANGNFSLPERVPVTSWLQRAKSRFVRSQD